MHVDSIPCLNTWQLRFGCACLVGDVSCMTDLTAGSGIYRFNRFYDLCISSWFHGSSTPIWLIIWIPPPKKKHQHTVDGRNPASANIENILVSRPDFFYINISSNDFVPPWISALHGFLFGAFLHKASAIIHPFHAETRLLDGQLDIGHWRLTMGESCIVLEMKATTHTKSQIKKFVMINIQVNSVDLRVFVLFPLVNDLT